MKGHLAALAAIAGLVGPSCGDDSPPGAAVHIEVVSGNAQRAVAGTEVAEPLVVSVTDIASVPVPRQVVSFRVVSGDGTALSELAITDDKGLARGGWLLGPGAGAQRLEARLPDPADGSSIRPAGFDAVAVAGPPASVTVIAGDGQAAPPETALAIPLRARVADIHDNPIAAIAVAFVAKDGHGIASPAMALTDSAGIAEATWSLGPTAGAQRIDARVVGATAASFSATARPTVAQTSDAAVASMQPGVSPFIQFVRLRGESLARLVAIRYTIAPRPGTASRAVDVTHSIDALQRRGYVVPGMVILPVFGLYADAVNEVSLRLQFDDASSQAIAVPITTAAYVDPNAVYDQPTILTRRAPGTPLGFDFFIVKSFLGTPVVLDTDGEIRWVGTGVPSSFSSLFHDGAFYVGDLTSTRFSRIELDSSTTSTSLLGAGFTAFHHNIDRGKHGLLVELDADDDGVASVESNLLEVTGAGIVLRHWDLAALLRGYMSSQGDDPDAFVRPGVDWFHMNGATYDPSDDSVIVSSRENFLIKLDYETGAIRWILGDPTKYWHTFPSLRAKALALDDGGLYPIGQHAPSITSDGLLMVFNNGFASLHQPTGESAGENRTFSAVSAYAVDPATSTAHEVWHFDHDQELQSIICSSAYEAADRSILIDYAVASQLSKARLVALDSARQVVFDFEYPTHTCDTAWNAQPIHLENLSVE